MRRSGTNLSNGSREQVDDPLMGYSDDALPVDLNDPVPDPDSSSLCDAPSQQTAYLRKNNIQYFLTLSFIYKCESNLPRHSER